MSHSNTAEQRGWYVYDFAQSAFSTTVVTLFLGPYLTALAKSAADAHGMVHPLGIAVDARSYWSYMVSLSEILQVLLLPMVGAIADYGRRKKEVLGTMAYLGAAVHDGHVPSRRQALFAGRCAVSDRQCELRRGRGDLQLVPAGDCGAGRSRCGLVEEDGPPATWAAGFCWR